MREFGEQHAHRGWSVSAKTSDAEVAPIQHALAQRRAAWLNPHAILQLQRTAGNKAVAGLLRETKKHIATGKPRTKLECRADIVHVPSGIGPANFVLADPTPQEYSDISKRDDRHPVGYTAPPRGAKAPKLSGFLPMNYIDPDPRSDRRKLKSVITPTLVQDAYEGDATAGYVRAGWHNTTLYGEGGQSFSATLYVSPHMSELVRRGEQAHVNDHRQAYKISLKEVEDVLKTHIAGKEFGPADTSEALARQISDAFKKNVKYPQLCPPDIVNKVMQGLFGTDDLSAYWRLVFWDLVRLSAWRDRKDKLNKHQTRYTCRTVAGGDQECTLVSGDGFEPDNPPPEAHITYQNRESDVRQRR